MAKKGQSTAKPEQKKQAKTAHASAPNQQTQASSQQALSGQAVAQVQAFNAPAKAPFQQAASQQTPYQQKQFLYSQAQAPLQQAQPDQAQYQQAIAQLINAQQALDQLSSAQPAQATFRKSQKAQALYQLLLLSLQKEVDHPIRNIFSAKLYRSILPHRLSISLDLLRTQDLGGTPVEITNQESVNDARIKSGKDRKKSREPVSSEPGTREDLQAKFSTYLYDL